MKQFWDRVRPVVLGAVCAGVAAGVACAVLHPMPLAPSLPSPLLSAKESPPGWEADRSFRFQLAEGEELSSRARYRSTGGDSTLQIELRYAPDVRKMFTADDALASAFVPAGFIPLDIQTHYLIDEQGNIQGNAKGAMHGLKPAELRRESGAGSYCFWSDGGRFHLSAVMCPVGGGIVTRKEFSHQLYIEQFHWSRLLPGKPPLFDPCSIIVDISTAQTDRPSDEALRQLQEAWRQWQPWCRALVTNL